MDEAAVWTRLPKAPVSLTAHIFPMGKAEPPTIAVHANRNTQEYNQVRPTIDNAAANVKESRK